MRYHAKERITETDQIEWFFEERDVSLAATNMQLVRIMIGKVKWKHRLVEVLRKVPIKQGDPGWNCVIWLKEALQALREDGKVLGRSRTEWQYVRDAAMRYIEQKKHEHRFDGLGGFDMSKAATYDLLAGGVETIP
jgi:hypothetical protein